MAGRSLCELERIIDQMIEDRRASRQIGTVILLCFFEAYLKEGKAALKLPEIRERYNRSIEQLAKQLGHSLGIGGKFNDTYPDRLVTRRKLLQRGDPSERVWALMPDVAEQAAHLAEYTRTKLESVLARKAGELVRLQKALTLDREEEPTVQRILGGTQPSSELLDDLAGRISDPVIRQVLTDPTSSSFRNFLEHGFEGTGEGIIHSPYGFEVCMFAILRVFLARFGCKLYRDTRTYGSEKGTDISTNFGVVYQVKKQCLGDESTFAKLVAELEQNFSAGRIEEGNVFVIAESERNGYGERLRREKQVNCLTKDEITALLDDLSPREKLHVLVCILQEMRRELVSRIKPTPSRQRYRTRAKV